MAHWLFKSEPDAWSWEQQKKKRAKGEPWSGVRNHTAKLNMKAMKKGDLGFFYHSNEQKAVVGIVEVIEEFQPDPTDEKGQFGLVVVMAKLAEMSLVNSFRLSVQPVKPAEWKEICRMGGLK